MTTNITNITNITNLDKILEEIISTNSSSHCIICFDDLTNSNCVLSRTENHEWGINKYCLACVEYYQEKMWQNYIGNIINADCEKSLIRSVNISMPRYLTVDLSFGSEPIYEYYFDKTIRSTELKIDHDPEVINQVNSEILEIKNKIGDETFDYLEAIDKLVNKFNLFKYKN